MVSASGLGGLLYTCMRRTTIQLLNFMGNGRIMGTRLRNGTESTTQEMQTFLIRSWLIPFNYGLFIRPRISFLVPNSNTNSKAQGIFNFNTISSFHGQQFVGNSPSNVYPLTMDLFSLMPRRPWTDADEVCLEGGAWWGGCFCGARLTVLFRLGCTLFWVRLRSLGLLWIARNE